MQEQQVREWLDDLVKNVQERQALEDFNSQISICNSHDKIHLYNGIEIVADLIGQELASKLKSYVDGRTRTELSFTYKGIEVMQLVGGEDGTD